MKKIFSIIVFCTWALTSLSQGIVQRGSSSVTNQDDRIKAKLNFYMPVASDTTLNGGLDSSGAQLMVVKAGDTSIYVRMPKPGGGRKWVKMLKSGDTNGVMRFNSRVGAVSLLASDVNTALGYVPVQGNGTNLQYLAGDGSKVTFPITTLTQGANVTITGTFPNFTISSTGGGGTVNLNSSRQSTQFAIKSSPTDSTIIQAADSLNGLAGAQTAAGKKKEQRQEPLISYAELRALTTYGAQVHYKALINKQFSDFYFDPASTQTDDSVMCVRPANISIGNPGRYLRYYENHINVEWFGAKPDDGIDDSYAFQKAINYGASLATAAHVKCGGGVFIVNNVVISKYVSGNASYVALTLEGSTPSYDGVVISAKSTEIQTTDPQGFSLAIQRGANVLIKNINFRGLVADVSGGGINALITRTDASWNSSGTVRDNHYSPHAAIVIDPFTSAVTGSDKYPNVSSSYYTNTTLGGSSLITMDGCSFRNYIVGVMVSPAPNIVNGDNIVFKNGNCYNNKIFWATGQAQTRGNSIYNLYSFGQIGTLVDGVTFGAQTGSAPTVSTSSLNGGTKYLYRVRTNFESVKFITTYSESLWSGGWSGGAFPVTFTDCNLNIEYGNTFHSPLFSEGGPISFKGGQIGSFDNTRAYGLTFKNDFVSFNGTTIQGGVPINFYPTSDSYGNISFDNVTYQNSEATSVIKKGVQESGSELFFRQFCNPSMIFQDGLNIQYRMRGPYFERVLTDSKVIHVDTIRHLAFFKSATPSLYRVNDYLTTTTGIDWNNDQFTSSATGLGWIPQISNDTIYLEYAPWGIDTTVTYPIYNTRMMRFLPRVLYNSTNGSNKLTSLISGGGGLPQVGARIKGPGIPDGTRTIFVSADSILLSANANATVTNGEAYDASMGATGTEGGSELSNSTRVYYAGDMFYNHDKVRGTLNYVRVDTAGLSLAAKYSSYYRQGSNLITGVGTSGVSTIWTGTGTIGNGSTFDLGGVFTAPILNVGANGTWVPGGWLIQAHASTANSYILFENSGNSSQTNFVRFDKTISGSHNIGAGTYMGFFEFNGLGAGYRAQANSDVSAGFSNFDHIWSVRLGSTAYDAMTLFNTGILKLHHYVAGVTQAVDTTNTKLTVFDASGNLVRSNWPVSGAAAVNARVDSLIASLLFDVIHTVTTTNTTPVTIDTLSLAANTQATYHLTFHGFDNTGVLNDALWYERRVLIKYSDGAVPTPTVQVIGTDIAEGTLNAVPPPVTFVVSGTLVFIKVASSSTMNIPWQISRTLTDVSGITAH